MICSENFILILIVHILEHPSDYMKTHVCTEGLHDFIIGISLGIKLTC